MENNQSASRAARRFLDDRVRTDWSWPNVPACWSASDEEVRGISEFRERFYGDSSPSASEDEDVGDPYKFDSPDSIGDAVERKVQNRKRKRRTALEDEMKDNEGLRIFIQRRDAWTGVASVKKYGTQRPKKAEQQTAEAEHSPSMLAEISSSNAPTPMSVDSQASAAHDATPATQEPLVPVAHRLLPDNAIRKSISPKTYPDIFNKIVVSSRSPSVPINLADMTKALVEGWKENGEWPPKAAPLDPLAGRKRAAIASVKAESGEPFLAHHPHLQKGMDSVRKIFHLNGPPREGGHGPGNAG
ncbi:hypothetical protein N0V90_005737 [Kalmusia sp. IMI 367209]|nr:hypothetical protein N0V90_005737 [Kalmusia sp. IMI 367209]